jgi:CDP-diacylglycerol--serine O-phosphatidyltransferase
LCDIVSFGIAPTFLAYQFGLSQLGKIGWIICFLFLACGALRLARFNVQSAIGKASKDFTGFPIPMAALWVACFILAVSDLRGVVNFETTWLEPLNNILKEKVVHVTTLAVILPFLSIMMVSNVAFRSIKTLKIRAVKPFKLLVIFVFVIALISYEPGLTGFVLTSAYAVSGPVEWVLGWKKAHDDDEIFASSPEDDDETEKEEERTE